VLATPLRLAWIDTYPPGLFYDPAGEGIDALRILNGARPVFLPANNGREPLLNYLMAGVFSLTGPTVAGIRLTVALIGLASLPVTFLWARAWFGPRVALLTAALMAVSTWHLFLSRFGVRAVLLPLLEPLAVLLIWRAAHSGRPLGWGIAGLVVGLSAYSYLPIRVFSVVIGAVVLGAVITERRRAIAAGRRRRVTFGLVQGVAVMVAVAALVAAPLVAYFVDNPTDLNARLGQVSLLGGRDAARQTADATVKTLGMLVWRGDQYPYTNVPGRPVFDLLVTPFFLFGLVIAVRKVRSLPYTLLLFWLAVMLLPGALTIAAPNFQRTAGLMPAIFVLPALGLATAARWLQARVRARPQLSAISYQPSAISGASLLRLGPTAVVIGSGLLTAHAYFVQLRDQPDLWRWYETDVAALAEHARALPPSEQAYALLPALPDVARATHQHATLSFLGGRQILAFDADTFPVADTDRRPATYLFPSPTEATGRVALPNGQEEWFADPFSGRALGALHIELGTPFQPQRAVSLRWQNELRLLGWTLARPPERPIDLVLFWAPAPKGVAGHFTVTMLEGGERPRETEIVRAPLRDLVCPPDACGEARAIAKRIYISSGPVNPASATTLRLYVLGENQIPLEAIDDAGRRTGLGVRLARLAAN